MKKNILMAFVLFIGLTTLVSCNSAKKQYMNSFGQFVSQVEDGYRSYTLEDWSWSWDQFQNFEDQFQVYQDKMSPDDIAYVADLEHRYLNTLKKAPASVLGQLSPIISRFMDNGQEWVESVGEHLNGLMEDFRELREMIGF